MKSQSARKVEYNSVFSRDAEYCSIRIAQIKLYFNGYAEYRSISRSGKPSLNLILVDAQSTGVPEEIRLD